jgi:hypothetical protein
LTCEQNILFTVKEEIEIKIRKLAMKRVFFVILMSAMVVAGGVMAAGVTGKVIGNKSGIENPDKDPKPAKSKSCCSDQKEGKSCTSENKDGKSCCSEKKDGKSCTSEKKDGKSCCSEKKDGKSCEGKSETGSTSQASCHGASAEKTNCPKTKCQ